MAKLTNTVCPNLAEHSALADRCAVVAHADFAAAKNQLYRADKLKDQYDQRISDHTEIHLIALRRLLLIAELLLLYLGALAQAL